jgi:hypothetical protein
MTGTSTNTGMKVMTTTTTIDAVRGVRRAGVRLIAWGLLVAPGITVRAAENPPQESAISTHAKSFATAVRRDSQIVGAKCKEGAHRVAVAAKAVAHEVATAAQRGASQTRAAFRGERQASTASLPPAREQ